MTNKDKEMLVLNRQGFTFAIAPPSPQEVLALLSTFPPDTVRVAIAQLLDETTYNNTGNVFRPHLAEKVGVLESIILGQIPQFDSDNEGWVAISQSDWLRWWSNFDHTKRKRTVNNLVKDGLIEVRVIGRVSRYRLTPKGWESLEKPPPKAQRLRQKGRKARVAAKKRHAEPPAIDTVLLTPNQPQKPPTEQITAKVKKSSSPYQETLDLIKCKLPHLSYGQITKEYKEAKHIDITSDLLDDWLDWWGEVRRDNRKPTILRLVQEWSDYQKYCSLRDNKELRPYVKAVISVTGFKREGLSKDIVYGKMFPVAVDLYNYGVCPEKLIANFKVYWESIGTSYPYPKATWIVDHIPAFENYLSHKEGLDNAISGGSDELQRPVDPRAELARRFNATTE